MADYGYPKKRNFPVLIVVVALVVVGAVMVGCSHSQKESIRNERIETGARPVMIDDEVNLMARINFEPGSARLTENSKRRISQALAKAETLGDVEEVKVMAWADREYPSNSKAKLSDSQQNLAVERSKAIRDYINVIDGDNSVDVDTYNMAKRPSAVSEFFKTTDAKMKSSVDKSRFPSDTAAKGVTRASSALLIFNLGDTPKDERLRHEAEL